MYMTDPKTLLAQKLISQKERGEAFLKNPLFSNFPKLQICQAEISAIYKKFGISSRAIKSEALKDEKPHRDASGHLFPMKKEKESHSKFLKMKEAYNN